MPNVHYRSAVKNAPNMAVFHLQSIIWSTGLLAAFSEPVISTNLVLEIKPSEALTFRSVWLQAK